MLTSNQIQQIRARCDAATPGPWRVEADAYDDPQLLAAEPVRSARSCRVRGCRCCYQLLEASWDTCAYVTAATEPADLEFLAAARTDVPALLGEIERLHQLLGSAGGGDRDGGAS